MAYSPRGRKELDTTERLIHIEKWGGSRGKGDKLGVWDLQIHTIIYKIDSKDLLYSSWNYNQYLVITYNGKACEKEIIYIYVRCVYN